ncbi:MAG: hypothetical protein ABL951_01185 [Alphaproteobacteria bacterium]
MPRSAFAALLAGLALQVLYWVPAHNIRVPWTGVGLAPSPVLARAFSLGDDQLYYRAAALGLQNEGDWAGELTPLANYDYARLSGWFGLLSGIDTKSQYAPTLAGYYFGQSRNPEQVRLIVAYLQQLAAAHPQTHWRWLAYSVYLARHRIHDLVLALELAYQLAALPVADMPIWTRQLPAFVLADTGEKEAARDILEAILESTPDLQKAEQNFMRNYIGTRLGFSPNTQ